MAIKETDRQVHAANGVFLMQTPPWVILAQISAATVRGQYWSNVFLPKHDDVIRSTANADEHRHAWPGVQLQASVAAR